MAPYKLFPKSLISRGQLSAWEVLFSVVLAGAWCSWVAQGVPQHGPGAHGQTRAIKPLLQPLPSLVGPWELCRALPLTGKRGMDELGHGRVRAGAKGVPQLPGAAGTWSPH